MRILFLHMFNFNTGWGGSASHLRALYNALTKTGHEVRVASPTHSDKYGLTTCSLDFGMELTFGPEKRGGEVTLDELGAEEIEKIAAAAARTIASSEFSGIKPDLIIANHINLMALTAMRLSGEFGVPYRIISHGTDTKLLLKDRRFCDILGVSARRAEKILSTSKFVAGEISATVGGNIEVLGGAVDPELFYPSPAVGRVEKRLVYAGRLVTEKGLRVLIDAFALQKSADELELVGEGPLRSEIEEYLYRSPFGSRVKLSGYVTPGRLRDILASAKLAVVPSLWQEPLGLAVVEAMACGVPVVASLVGGIPEMISDGINGLLVPPGDPRALAAAIDKVLGDRAVYERILEGVRKTAIPSYHDLALKVIGKL